MIPDLNRGRAYVVILLLCTLPGRRQGAGYRAPFSDELQVADHLHGE